MSGPRFNRMALPAPVREEMNRLQTEALQAEYRAKEAVKVRSREEANRRRAQGRVNHLEAVIRRQEKKIRFLETAFHQANERGAKAQERAGSLEIELAKLRAERKEVEE